MIKEKTTSDFFSLDMWGNKSKNLNKQSQCDNNPNIILLKKNLQNIDFLLQQAKEHKNNAHYDEENSAIKNNNVLFSANSLEKPNDLALSNVKCDKVWTQEEEAKLLSLTSLLGAKKWKSFAENHFPNKTGIQCSIKYRKLNSKLKKGKWTAEENKELLKYVQIYGKNWFIISKFMKTRTSSQIRDKYLKTFDPCINKTRFTEQEDKIIVEKFKVYGGDWNRINSFLSNRSAGMVKTRFYSQLRKKCGLSN